LWSRCSYLQFFFLFVVTFCLYIVTMQVKMQRLFNQQPPRPVRVGGRGAGPAAPPVRRPRPRRYPDVSIAELMASPSRLQMPLIHTEKENSGLW
ncbi:unnamed protein product, partial [Brassica oleracea]